MKVLIPVPNTPHTSAFGEVVLVLGCACCGHRVPAKRYLYSDRSPKGGTA